MSENLSLEQIVRAGLVAAGWSPVDTPTVHARLGMPVTTLGPWSNGHDEQTAVITHVYGDGLPGDLVNLFIFVDLGQPLVTEMIPWFPTRRAAEQALAADPEKANITGGAVCCYLPNKV